MEEALHTEKQMPHTPVPTPITDSDPLDGIKQAIVANDSAWFDDQLATRSLGHNDFSYLELAIELERDDMAVALLPHFSDKVRELAMVWAMECQRSVVIDRLLETEQRDGEPPPFRVNLERALIWATAKPWERGVHQLLALGAKADGDSTTPLSALDTAASRGHTTIVAELMGRVTQAELRGQALNSAASKGHVDTVHILLDGTTPRDWSEALFFATQATHTDLAQVILDRLVPAFNADQAQAKSGGPSKNPALLANGSEVLFQATYDSRMNWEQTQRHRENHKEAPPPPRPEAFVPPSIPEMCARALIKATEQGNVGLVKRILPLADAHFDQSAALRWAVEMNREDLTTLLLPGSDPEAARKVWTKARPARWSMVSRLATWVDPELRHAWLKADSSGRLSQARAMVRAEKALAEEKQPPTSPTSRRRRRC